VSYARGTFAALVDAMVPETPELADRGEEQVPGGLGADVDAHLVEAFDDLSGGEDGGLSPSPSTAVSGLLDLAAVELLARRHAEDGLQSPAAKFARGPFSRLSRRDRLRALRLLEADGLLADVGAVDYLVQSLVIVTQVAYYSDWFTEQGWEQAGYPGPADGYSVLLGYEVEAFAEDDY
jgi:hypothetical protein